MRKNTYSLQRLESSQIFGKLCKIIDKTAKRNAVTASIFASPRVMSKLSSSADWSASSSSPSASLLLLPLLSVLDSVQGTTFLKGCLDICWLASTTKYSSVNPSASFTYTIHFFGCRTFIFPALLISRLRVISFFLLLTRKKMTRFKTVRIDIAGTTNT